MLQANAIQKNIQLLTQKQQAGVTLADAIQNLHMKENVAFDLLWPAVMQIRQLSEKQAMQITKDWCLKTQ